MTVLRVNTLSGIGTGGPVFGGELEFNSQNYVILPKGTTSDRVGLGSTPGALRYNTDSNKVELWDGNQWAEVQASRPDLNGGARGLNGAGYDGVRSNVIEYFNIASTGNATDFGDLFTGSYGYALSSSTRGIWGGGAMETTPVTATNRIEYVTISSTGNGTDFGDLLTAQSQLNQGCSSATRGLFSGGGGASARVNVIQYITISSTGNAQDFGDLTRLVGRGGSLSSPTRGIFAGGAPTDNVSTSNVIDFVTISTLGNASDFGDLTAAKQTIAGCSNATRGLFGGGGTPTVVNTIEYITIATLGNSIKFGDLTTSRSFGSACSSSTRGVWCGGLDPAQVNTMDYATISTQGNAVDFGDLPRTVYINASVSNAHGGL